MSGGKPRRANDKDNNNDAPRGRGTSKTPVVGAVERGGRLKAKPVKSNEMRADDMSRYTREMVNCSRSIVTTDEYSGYCKLHRFVAHRTINHSRIYLERDMFDDQYGQIHTNTIESAWAILKRAIMGQYHRISRKYGSSPQTRGTPRKIEPEVLNVLLPNALGKSCALPSTNTNLLCYTCHSINITGTRAIHCG
jgi:hypothetical protein